MSENAKQWRSQPSSKSSNKKFMLFEPLVAKIWRHDDVAEECQQPIIYVNRPLERATFLVLYYSFDSQSHTLVGAARHCVCPDSNDCIPKPLLGLSPSLWKAVEHVLDTASFHGVKPIDPVSLPLATSIMVSPETLQGEAVATFKRRFSTAVGGALVTERSYVLYAPVSCDPKKFVQIVSVHPSPPDGGPVRISQNPSIVIDSNFSSRPGQLINKRPKGLEAVGGLDTARPILEDIVLMPLLHPEQIFSEDRKSFVGLKPPRGVLLYGIPGTGKSFLSQAVAAELEARWAVRKIKDSWNMPTIASLSAATGDLHCQHINQVFQDAKIRFLNHGKMTLLLVDEIDGVCPKRESAAGNPGAIAFLTHLDATGEPDGVIILATTNRPDSLDEAIRRPGRLDWEVELDVPTAAERGKILFSILENSNLGLPAGVDSVLVATDLAKSAHGCVPADLQAWASCSSILARKQTVDHQWTRAHFEATLAQIRPSALRELHIQIPLTRWTDIGGYDNVKSALRESVEWPLKYAHLFEAMKLNPPRGILMYGPPGNSKTIMAKAVASESSMNFISVKGPEIFSKWVGESERTIRNIFKKARRHAPSIIFFDEIDALSANRGQGSKSSGVENRVLSQMLNEMDGICTDRHVVIIGATNRPEIMDPALMRPGRFDKLLYVPLPDLEARKSIFSIQLRGIEIVQNDDGSLWPLGEACSYMGNKTEGFSGAEIAMIASDARMAALRETILNGESTLVGVQKKHFDSILNEIRPRTPKDMILFYEEFSKSQQKKFIN